MSGRESGGKRDRGGGRVPWEETTLGWLLLANDVSMPSPKVSPAVLEVSGASRPMMIPEQTRTKRPSAREAAQPAEKRQLQPPPEPDDAPRGRPIEPEIVGGSSHAPTGAAPRR